jgi:hypothetical protein
VAHDLDAAERQAAEDVVGQLAPDELPLLRQLMARPTWRDRWQGNSIGYGIGSQLEIVAPYALLTVTWARSVVVGEAKTVLEKRLRELTRRVLRVPKEDAPTPPTLPSGAVDPNELRAAVEKYASDLGMKRAKATLLADAVCGRVLPGAKS